MAIILDDHNLPFFNTTSQPRFQLVRVNSWFVL